MGKSCWMASLKCNVHKVLYGRCIERAMVAFPPHKTCQLHIFIADSVEISVQVHTQGCMAQLEEYNMRK